MKKENYIIHHCINHSPLSRARAFAVLLMVSTALFINPPSVHAQSSNKSDSTPPSSTENQPDNSELHTSDRPRRSAINLSPMFFYSISADALHSYLYKNPVLGGLNMGYAFLHPITEQQINIKAGAGKAFSPYISDPDYPAYSDLAFQIQVLYTGTYLVWHTDALSLQVGHGTHFYVNAWIPDEILRYTWVVHTGLGPSVLLNWKLHSDHTLSFGMYMPVFGIAWRPDYSGYTLKEETELETEGFLPVIFSNMHLVSFHNLIVSDLRVVYEYTLSPSMVLLTEYNIHFEYMFVPRDRMEFQHNVSIGLSFRL